jgi:hypothetical protein
VQEFDVRAFYVAADAKRCEQNTNWSALARQLGMKPDTLLKLQHGRTFSLGTLVRILEWMGETDLQPYMRQKQL